MLLFDLQWFRELNSLAGQSVLADAGIVFLAHWLILFEGAVIVAWAFWSWHLATRRLSFVERLRRFWRHAPAASVEPVWIAARAAAASSMAYVFNAVVGFIWFRERPFVALHDVARLIDKSALQKSFPSDHATIAFAMAAAVTMTRPVLGIALLAAAALVSFGRVMAGVHYPTDIMAGAIVGCFWALVVFRIERRWRGRESSTKH